MSVLDTRSNLRGRKAAIIGGADGIGKAVTMALVSAEVDVAFCDINVDARATFREKVSSRRGEMRAAIRA